MKQKLKKICLIFAGGTALDEVKISETSVYKETDVDHWLELVPELKLLAKIEPLFIKGEIDELNGPNLWSKVSQQIYKNYAYYDGFVILNDPESILHLGIALSLALKNLARPVVLTGSQVSERSLKIPERSFKKAKSFGGLGVKSNLINAVQMATMDFPLVSLIFGNQCLRPVKAERTAVYALNIFSSADSQYLAKVDFGISPEEKLESPTGRLILKNKFEPAVIYLKYYPGLSFAILKNLLTHYQGLILESLTGIPIPKELVTALSKLKSPIIIYNRLYLPRLNRKNLIEISELTPETALVKLMWALGQTHNLEEIRNLMYEDFCWEFLSSI